MTGRAAALALREKADELAARGRAAEAVEAYQGALSGGVADAALYSNLGVMLIQLERNAEALEVLERAAALAPGHPAVIGNRGLARHALGRIEEAVADYRAALLIEPRYADAHTNLALALWRQGEAAAARASAANAEACLGIGAEALKNLGQLAREMGDLDRGEALLRRALVIDPGHIASHYALAGALLARGEWREGWREYAWRAQRLRRGYARADDGLPRPLPADLGGRLVCLHGEQGPGDTLFFLRYASVLRGRGARLAFRGEARLLAMVRRTALFEDVAESREEPEDALDIHVADLPYLLDDASSPSRPPPLRLLPQALHLEAAEERLAAFGLPPYIGVTWRAGKRPAGEWKNRYFKRIDPAGLGAALADVPGTIVVLQRAPQPGETEAFTKALGRPAADASDANADLEVILGLLAQLHAYAGVSNTNMHLAAGIGLRAQVLVPHPPEWRWMDAGEASPWFPGFRVFREDPRSGWGPALAGLRRALASRAAG